MTKRLSEQSVLDDLTRLEIIEQMQYLSDNFSSLLKMQRDGMATAEEVLSYFVNVVETGLAINNGLKSRHEMLYVFDSVEGMDKGIARYNESCREQTMHNFNIK